MFWDDCCIFFKTSCTFDFETTATVYFFHISSNMWKTRRVSHMFMNKIYSSEAAEISISKLLERTYWWWIELHIHRGIMKCWMNIRMKILMWYTVWYRTCKAMRMEKKALQVRKIDWFWNVVPITHMHNEIIHISYPTATLLGPWR